MNLELLKVKSPRKKRCAPLNINIRVNTEQRVDGNLGWLGCRGRQKSTSLLYTTVPLFRPAGYRFHRVGEGAGFPGLPKEVSLGYSIKGDTVGDRNTRPPYFPPRFT